MYGKALFYFIGCGAVGVALLQLCQPNPAEIKQIQAYANNRTLAVVKSAASSPEPLYRQSSAQIQQKALEAVRQMEAASAAAKTK